MLRLMLVLVTVASSCFVGQHFSMRLQKREEALSLFLFNLETALPRVEYSKSTVYEMFESFHFDRDQPFYPQWEALLMSYRYLLSKEDMSMLREFGEGIGSSDEEYELNRLRLYISLIKEKLTLAKSDIEKKSKLYRIGGFSFGMAIALLLI